MRRVVLVSCAIGLLWPASAFAQPTGRLLVSMRPGAATAAMAGVAGTGRDVPELRLRVVRPRAGEALRAAARRLRRDPQVRHVDVEQRADQRLIPDDPAINVADPTPAAHGETLQWWAVRENFPAAWALADGDSVAVAVIDQGVDVDPSGPRHEDPPHDRSRPRARRRLRPASITPATARTSPHWPAGSPATGSAWPAPAMTAA